MKRNLDQPIIDLDGKQFDFNQTLKTICFSVMSTPLEGDDKMQLDVRLKQYDLVRRINVGGVVDLSSEDISLIKSRGVKCIMNIIALGRMCEMLEQEYINPEQA